MVALNLFGRSDAAAKGHDRYLVYRLIGRRVSFPHPSKRVKSHVSARVADVCRNIFDNEVELVLEDGRTFRFKEPAAILERGGDVVFVYGDVGERQMGDKAMFREMRAAQYAGETFDETLKRTELERTRHVRLSVEKAEG